MAAETGTKFGRYEIRSKIGEGGMGEVYLAQDTKLDRKVALKILLGDLAAHRSRMGRFVQEARTASALNHPNILTIYEIDETDPNHFIGTEFIEGETPPKRERNPPRLSESLRSRPVMLPGLSTATSNLTGKIARPGRGVKLLNELKQESSQRYIQSYAFKLIYIGLGEKRRHLPGSKKKFLIVPPNAIF